MSRAWKRKLTSDADFGAMPKLKNGLQVIMLAKYNHKLDVQTCVWFSKVMLIGSSTGIPKPAPVKSEVVCDHCNDIGRDKMHFPETVSFSVGIFTHRYLLKTWPFPKKPQPVFCCLLGSAIWGTHAT